MNTKNYKNLQDVIKTQTQAREIEGVIVIPHTYIERATVLLKDFISEYLETVDGTKAFICDLHTKPNVIRAKLESITEHVELAENMLNECCEYQPG